MNQKPKTHLFHPRSLELPARLREPHAWSREIAAGVTVGMIALPLALALGIASVPAGADTPLSAPAIGIVTAIVAGLLVSLFGGSRVQVAGPTAAFMPLVLLIISEHGYGGLLVATMMAGAMLIVMGFTRLGGFIKFIPWPVTSGFTTGIAVVLMLTQIPDFLGVNSAGTMPTAFFARVAWILALLPAINTHAAALAVGCVGFLFAWPRVGLSKVPSSLAAIIVAALFVAGSGWDQSEGVATIGSKFGAQAIPSHLPMPQLPRLDWAFVQSLVGPAAAIAMLGAIESLLSAVVADGLSGDRHDSNTELIAQGIANLVSPLFGGLPVTGAIARTSANITYGGQTPLSGIVHSLTLMLVVLIAAPLAGEIPMAAIAAILMVVALKMGQWREFGRVLNMPKSDAAVFFTTFTLTVVFDLVLAVQMGMLLAGLLFIKRVSDTTEVRHVTLGAAQDPEALHPGIHTIEVPEDVEIYQIFGPFLFGTAEKLEQALDELDPWPRVFILRLGLVTAMDLTGLNALRSVTERMRARGGMVLLCRVYEQPLRTLERSGFLRELGPDNVCDNLQDSLARAKSFLALPPTNVR